MILVGVCTCPELLVATVFLQRAYRVHGTFVGARGSLHARAPTHRRGNCHSQPSSSQETRTTQSQAATIPNRATAGLLMRATYEASYEGHCRSSYEALSRFLPATCMPGSGMDLGDPATSQRSLALRSVAPSAPAPGPSPPRASRPRPRPQPPSAHPTCRACLSAGLPCEQQARELEHKAASSEGRHQWQVPSARAAVCVAGHRLPRSAGKHGLSYSQPLAAAPPPGSGRYHPRAAEPPVV